MNELSFQLPERPAPAKGKVQKISTPTITFLWGVR